MKKIDRAGIGLAAIIGGAEMENDTVQLRDLRDSSQTEMPQDGFAAFVAARLASR